MFPRLMTEFSAWCYYIILLFFIPVIDFECLFVVHTLASGVYHRAASGWPLPIPLSFLPIVLDCLLINCWPVNQVGHSLSVTIRYPEKLLLETKGFVLFCFCLVFIYMKHQLDPCTFSKKEKKLWGSVYWKQNFF